MPTRTLEIVLAGDPASASRAFRKVEQDAGRMGKSLDREGGRVRGFATVTSKGFSRVGAAATGMAAVGTGAIGLLAKSFVSGASDIDESLSKNQELFGRHAATIDKWSKTTARSLGISRSEALQSAGAFGSLFETIGLADRPAAQMSRRFVQLAADLASFHNATPTDALEALRSGLVGESEPMRRFGALLSETRVKQEAWSTGIARSGAELTEQQKVQARYQLILKDTTQAHGDAERTGGMFAGQMRRLKAQLADTGASIGAVLIPFVLKAVQAINGLIGATRQGQGPLAAMARGFQRIANAAEDTIGWFRQHRTTTTVLMSVVAAATAAFVSYRTAVLASMAATKIAAAATKVMAAATAALNVVLRANPIGIVITALVALGAGLVVAYKRSETFRRIVDTAFSVVKSRVERTANAIKGVVVPAFNAIRDVAEAVAKAVGWVGRAFSTAKDAVGGAADWIIPGGDGIGRMDVTGLGGTGGLRGADPDLGPFAAIGRGMGLSVTSGIRPGDTTLSGNTSYHSSGDAIDMGGSMSGMRRFAGTMFSRFGGRLRELISPWSELGIKDGRPYRYSGAIQAQHSGSNAHVHLAYTGPFGDGLGKFQSTAYGPPWNAMNGTGVTATGVDLRPARQMFGIAIDPNRLKLGKNYYVWPNPFGRKGPFKAFDTGGAIKGNRIDFYDWRGRRSQMSWGRRAVTVSDDPALNVSSGGPMVNAGGGRGGGGPSASGPSSRTEAPTGPGAALGYDGEIARVGVQAAKAQASDNLAKLIQARQAERALKQGRLRTIRKELRTKMRKARRVRLLNEEAQLVEEIDALNESISEYMADKKGGATTISRAEELEAGVDTSTAGADIGGGTATTDDGSAALASELAALRASIDASRQFAERVNQTEPFQIKKYLADLYSGHVVGYGVVPRSFTPGSGVEYVY